ARFEVTREYTAVGGGRPISSRVIVRSSVQEYELDLPGKYFSVAVGRFTQVPSLTSAGVKLNAFGPSFARKETRRYLEAAGRILEFFTERFGPCPYNEINLALVDGLTPGGHSPPGMVLVSERSRRLKRNLRDDPADFTAYAYFVLAHELAHQWWGQGVAPSNYHERWLSEGMAQYSAALWTEETQGAEARRGVLASMRYWVWRMNDHGPISLGYRLGHIQRNSQIFRAIVYNKGGYVLHMLRQIVGDEAFFAALKELQRAHRFEKIGTGDLRAALEKASGYDLSAYFDVWIYQTALPLITVRREVHREGHRYRVDFDFATENFPGPLPLRIDITHREGRESTRILLPPQGGRWPIYTKLQPTKVAINSELGLLAKIR
ncbi:MAG: hypothetical protein MUF51_03470, partial [Vicinamibacteria bacterium]|nr:hypothetical protein [Vicinamibacteria bacterium]